MGGPVDPVAHAALVYDIAEAADRLGFHAVWAGDHLALPRAPTTPYPYGGGRFLATNASLLDPFAVLAALAGRTTRVRLGFGVLVAPYRHPLVTAKLVASIDALSGGRVILGVGTGWMPEEFAAVGAGYDARGQATDDTLQYLARVLAAGEVDGMPVLPTPVPRPGPPVWVGGRATAAIRRAVKFGSAWDAPFLRPAELRSAVERLRGECDQQGRDPTTIGVSVRGLAADDVDDGVLGAYAACGVTHVGVVLPVRDRERAIETLQALAERVPTHLEH
jgi:probable F420-dependent oxidoreductase